MSQVQIQLQMELKNFHKNIEVYISGNSFSKIVEVFEEILH